MTHWDLLADGGEVRGGLACFSLDPPSGGLEALAALLSPEERARAARFHAAEHGARYTVAHARLRQLLASVLGADARGLQFAAGPHGKPALAGDAAAGGLQFNLSHSGNLGLAGWAWGRDIGVDIEGWRDMRDEAALVKRYFSQAENAAYEALPPASRTEGFFNAWTRKEAYVKAVGRGLGLPLASFDVSLESSSARLLRASADAADGRVWSMAAPALAPRVSLAVVLQSGTLFVAPNSQRSRLDGD